MTGDQESDYLASFSERSEYLVGKLAAEPYLLMGGRVGGADIRERKMFSFILHLIFRGSVPIL